MNRLLVGSIALAILSVVYRNYSKDYRIKIDDLKQSYDFIIGMWICFSPIPIAKFAGSYICLSGIAVGAGSAGSILASRLAEIETVSVLLVEAGPDEYETGTWWSHIPGYFTWNRDHPEIDWMYKSVPQTQSGLGLVDKIAKIPRGKVLGGSSITNYMKYVRGSPNDFDSWADIMHDRQWAFDNVLPYFKKLETILFQSHDSELRGHSGPIKVRKAPQTPLGQAFLRAVQEFGYKVLDDYNGKSSSGFSVFQNNVDEWGLRSSPSKEYLHPAMKARPNLHVLTKAHVTKLEFSASGVLLGVQLLHSGQVHSVHSSREVHLCAGAIGTPQLLQLSGVGSKELMKQLQIPQVVDLPAVGENLRDHIMIHTGYNINTTTAGYPQPNMFYDWLNLLFRAKGALTFSGGEVNGLFKSDESLSRDDLQAVLFPWDLLADPHTFTVSNVGEEISKWWHSLRKSDGGVVTVVVYNQHPYSLGNLRIASTDPMQHPNVNLNYLDDKRDVQSLIKGLKIAEKMVLSSKSLAQFSPTKMHGPLPSCSKHEYMSDDYLECLIRQFTLNVYHQVGTCTMGLHPNTSVVDTTLRVHGVPNLRIVDASVFPTHITGNTHVAVLMLAEKAADMIKRDIKPI